MRVAEDTLNQAVGRRDQTRPSHNGYGIAIGNLKIGNRTVPVVQRKEQEFPKTKVTFYHTSSAVVSALQTASR